MAVLGVTGNKESLIYLFLFLPASSLDSLAANVKVILAVAFVKLFISSNLRSIIVLSPMSYDSLFLTLAAYGIAVEFKRCLSSPAYFVLF